MSHLTDNRIYDLALKIETDAIFTPEDLADLDHIGQCDNCYLLLRSTMALIHITDHMEDYISSPVPVSASAKISRSVSAVINLVVNRVTALLSPVEGQSWQFDAPLAAAGTRGQGGETAIQILEDLEDEQNFVVYDPEKKLLCIQLIRPDDEPLPRILLVHSDGSTQEIHLVDQGDILWAEISGLEEGSYQLILEK